jgi:hypothetical protein
MQNRTAEQRKTGTSWRTFNFRGTKCRAGVSKRNPEEHYANSYGGGFTLTSPVGLTLEN